MIPYIETKIRVPFTLYEKIRHLKDTRKIKSINSFALTAFEDKLKKENKRVFGDE